MKIKKLNKEVLLAAVFTAAGGAPLWADDLIPAGMTNLAQKISGVFNSPLVSAIFVIVLCACAVMFAVNKDNEKLKKGIVAIAVAVALIGGSTKLVGTLIDASK
jgi:hypothetical protein